MDFESVFLTAVLVLFLSGCSSSDNSQVQTVTGKLGSPTPAPSPASSPGISPVVSIGAAPTTPSNFGSHTSATFELTMSDPGGAGISSATCQLDTGPTSSCSQGPVTYTGLSDSSHVLKVTATNAEGNTASLSIPWIDCAANNPNDGTKSNCATLNTNDPESLSPFHGFADPTIRKDPGSATLWLGYSWPNTWPAPSPSPGASPSVGSTQVVDLHIAASTDNGVTWGSPSILWKSKAVTDPSTGLAAYTSNEVMNIVPGLVNGQSTGTTWFSAHLAYIVDVGKSITASLVRTSVIELTWASAPSNLGGVASSQIVNFAGAGTNANIPRDLDLQSLDPSLQNCQQWGEPALLMKQGNLYMALQCKYGTSDTMMVPSSNFYGVFETTPNLAVPAKQWVWTYNGQLAGPAEAHLLEDHQYLYELDLAAKADGSIVAIVTPADISPIPNNPSVSTQFTYGCRAVLVRGLDKNNIGLVKDANGQLVILASATSSDLSPANGDKGIGGCTYEPSASNGIIYVRQYYPDTRFPSLEFWVGLFNTYLMP